jgi:hypothetical protein
VTTVATKAAITEKPTDKPTQKPTEKPTAAPTTKISELHVTFHSIDLCFGYTFFCDATIVNLYSDQNIDISNFLTEKNQM